MVLLFQVVMSMMMIGYTEAESLKQQILDSLVVNTSYDKRVPPGIDFGELHEEQPTNVSVQLIITQMYTVNVDEMDFSISFYLRQKWMDYRLQFNLTNTSLQLSHDDINRIWTPDTYFPDSKDGDLHRITKPNSLLHIHPNGSVFYSLRLYAKLGCNMEFYRYPLDVQMCRIRMESYGFTKTKLLYSWYEQYPVVVQSENLPLYNTPRIPATTVDTCRRNVLLEGFSCLVVTIQLQRSIEYYMTEVFIPDILIVLLSWVTFWLHPLAVPGRVSLGAVTVLTMTSQGSSSRRNAPKVSYVKAMDVWTLFQIMFVFAAMLEFSIVNVLARRKVTEERARQLLKEKAFKSKEPQEYSHNTDEEEKVRPFLGKAKWIDRISRVAFPATYIIFNVMFWVIVYNV